MINRPILEFRIIVLFCCISAISTVELYAQNSDELTVASYPQKLDDLKSHLDEVINSNVNSYHILLWKSFHALRGLGLENETNIEKRIDWNPVQSALERQHVELSEHWPHDSKGGYFIYVFKKDISLEGSEFLHDFYVLFVVDEKSGAVVRAEPHLKCKVHLPFEDPKIRHAYSPSSVGSRLLKIDETISNTAKYPIIEGIDISYQALVNRWLDFWPMGFYLELERSGTSKDGERLTGKFTYSVGSSLDPIYGMNGKPLSNDPFKPEDKLFNELSEGSELGVLENGKPGIFLSRGGGEGVGPKPGE